MTGRRILAALIVLAAAVFTTAAAADVTWIAPELLGRPTASSVSVSAMAASDLEVYFEYGTASGSYTAQTPTVSCPGRTPFFASMSGLSADTAYFYRMRYRAPGAGAFEARPESSFHTARPPHSSFVFTVQSDSHIYDKKGDHDLYAIDLQNQLADGPDFMFDLGDTFGDDHQPYTITYAEEDQLHLDQRPFMGIVGRSAPVMLCIGNHEGEAGYYIGLTPPDNLAIYSTKARHKYFANPIPDGFYTGNPEVETYVGLPQNYYAWTWGDALFVVLDAYRYNAVDPKDSGTLWDWTLGKDQYDWFRATLEGSRARYKFVFLHHVLGQTRGGVSWAGLYEWGGKDKNGNYIFDTKRPGWGKPIHQLLVENHVDVLFQGHDHLYAREELDGVVYQEVPMPSDATYHVGDVNADAYTGVVLNNTGHLRVSVAKEQVTVDYVRAYLPGDGTNGEVAYTYTLASRAPLAAFEMSAATPTVGQTVSFTDQSTLDPATWSWDFGDGESSTMQNPSHAYEAAGTYTVTLTAANAFGQDSSSRTLVVSAAPPTAAFTLSPEAPVSGKSVQFTDASSGSPTSWAWYFGDGATSALQNPAHTYAAPGEYTVTLAATNAGGSSTVSHGVTVAAACTISSVVKATLPFRLKVYGASFQPGATVTVNGTAAPLTTYVSGGKVVAKSGLSLKALVPVGVPVQIVVVNPDGGTSAPFSFTR